MYKNTWTIHQNTVYWCNLKVAQKKRLQFYQTRSNANVFFFTLPAICIEKKAYMKSGKELYNKVHQSPSFTAKKPYLTPNLHHGRQGLSNLEARTSADHQSKARRTVKPVAKSSRRLEAVTSTSEYRVYHTQPFRRKTMFAEKQSKD